MNSEEERKMQMKVGLQSVDMKSVLLSLLMLVLVVWILKVSYNNVIPNITKQGSLKLGKVNWTQALSLMILSGMLCCTRM